MMRRTSAPSPYSIWTIDLMRSHFEWHGGPSGKPLDTYSAVMRIWSKEIGEEKHVGAFCDFVLKRQGYKSENFGLTADYYFAVDFDDDAEKDFKLDVLREVARAFVWSRFFELARFLLSHAGIKDVDIPIELESVSVRDMPALA